METTMRRTREQRVEDLERLARKGEAQGVRILVDHRTGQHVATSASDPTRCSHVDTEGCTCRGFAHWGRCKHHSLLLAELGRLEGTEPEPPTPVVPVLIVLPVGETPCHNCGGHGWGYGTVAGGHLDRVTCWTCDGSGVEPATAVAA